MTWTAVHVRPPSEVRNSSDADHMKPWSGSTKATLNARSDEPDTRRLLSIVHVRPPSRVCSTWRSTTNPVPGHWVTINQPSVGLMKVPDTMFWFEHVVGPNLPWQV